MAETKTYQGHTYTRNGPNDPWTLTGVAVSPTGILSDPYKAADEQRKNADQQRQDANLARETQQTNISAQNASREANRNRLQNPQDLRQEYEKLAEVTTYKTVLQQARRAMDTDANPQGDLALTYAFAKAMDPTSSVREGEQAAVAGSQPIADSVVENIKKQFKMDGAGSYTPQARAALRQQIFRQVASAKPLYDRARADMTDNAKAVGVDPKEVIGRNDTETYAPMFRDYGEKAGDPNGVISHLIGGEPIKTVGGTGTGIIPQGPAPTAAGYGATTASVKIPPEMQAEYSGYLAKNWGKLDPEGLAAFRINLDRKYGFPSNDAQYRADAPYLNAAAQKGATPDQVPAIPAPDRQLSGGEQFRNNLVDNPYGAAAATAMNGLSLGIPGALAGDQMGALRAAHPGPALAGDIVGGIGGAMLTGGGLRGVAGALDNPTIAGLLAKPLAGDLAYGTAYGANNAIERGDDPVVGALTGGAGGFIGNKVGGAIGKAFPSTALLGGAVRDVDAAVPSSQDLKTLASGIYKSAEGRGLTATPDDTLALADSTKAILAKEGRITAKDNLAATDAKTNTAYKLINDHAGEPMSPTQIETTRGVIADGLASPEPSDRRISSLLLKNFDDWTDATNPDLAEGLADGRAVSSRYLQGDKIAQARDLADVRAGQFSNSGQGNALRTDFRQLDRGIVKGNEQFAPGVADAIAEVSRGTPASNALRMVGKFAPTSGVSSIPTLLAMSGAGAAAGVPGVVGGAALGGLALGARQLGQGLTERAAQVAENSAYGGPEYVSALNDILAKAALRGGNAGAGAISDAGTPYVSDPIARALANLQGNTVAN